MTSFNLLSYYKGKRIPKLLFESKESKKQYKLIGCIEVSESEAKLVLEGETKLIISLVKLKREYIKVKYYE